jgi:hypothetical protein
MFYLYNQTYIIKPIDKHDSSSLYIINTQYDNLFLTLYYSFFSSKLGNCICVNFEKKRIRLISMIIPRAFTQSGLRNFALVQV